MKLYLGIYIYPYIKLKRAYKYIYRYIPINNFKYIYKYIYEYIAHIAIYCNICT